jgi:serine/threonine-protein kinase
MTQGRKPPPEPDDSSTLFEPKESSGAIAERTPVPPGVGKGHVTPATPTDVATSAYESYVPPRPSDRPRDDDATAPDTPSASGIPIDLEGMGSLKPGQVLFDCYIVERQLGEGGMGTVWLVRHRELDSERALKLIVSGIARDPQARARFRREAQILDRLNHPGAVRVYNAQMGQDVAFIEMEFVRGQSLNQILVPGQPMPLDWTVDLLDQLCDVLQAANDIGIIHRDLKPPNLMLVEGKKPGTKVLKLLDFGIAKIREGADDVRTLTGSFMGTPLYSSPEQIVGEKVDVRSDIYSVGLILYELLTGHRPFDGSINAIIYKHTMVPPPPFAEVNPTVKIAPQVEAVVLKCLAKDPDERPQSPRALAESFHTALAEAGIEVKTRPAPGAEKAPLANTLETTVRLTRPLARAARAVGLIAALGVVAAVLVAIVQGLRFPGFANGSPGVTSRLESLTTNVPKTPRVVDNRFIEQQLARWKDQGFVPDKKAGTDAGWPKTLLRVEDLDEKNAGDRVPFEHHGGGVYIPKGYEPSPEKAADGYPQTLAREGAVIHRIPGGRFRMGALKSAQIEGPGAEASQPGPEVELSGFYMQRTEVTNGQFEPYYNELGGDLCPEWKQAYDKLALPSVLGPQEARKLPVSFVPWWIADQYARAKGGKLPTEAQWEYAARSGGLNKLYVWGNGPVPSDPANLRNTRAVEVAHYPLDVTDQGIRDMAGNVREWCRDVSKPYEPSAQVLKDPQNPPPRDQSDRLKMVVRGGSYLTGVEQNIKTIAREENKGDMVTPDLGFRIVVECPSPPDVPH